MMRPNMPSERVQRRIDALLDDADSALADRDWQAAAEICQAVLVLDLENEDAQSYLAAAQKALSERGSDPRVDSREEASEEIHPEPVEGRLSSDTSTAPRGTTPARQPSAPISSMELAFADGRYQVKEILGEGGTTLPTTPRLIATWRLRSSRWKAWTM